MSNIERAGGGTAQEWREAATALAAESASLRAALRETLEMVTATQQQLRGAVGDRDEALRYLRELTLREGNHRAVSRTLRDVRTFLDRLAGGR